MTPLACATTYKQWSAAARHDDERTGRERWRREDASPFYDSRSLRRRLERFAELQELHNVPGLVAALEDGIHWNTDGMGHPSLWRKARSGTKHLIEEYVETVAGILEALADRCVSDRSAALPLRAFDRLSRGAGRSSLMLSGAGSYLYFHAGVVRTLHSEGALPRVISGSSGGAMIAALVGTHRDEEALALLTTERLAPRTAIMQAAPPAGSRFVRVSTHDEIVDNVARIVADLTFGEALELTGRHLNISVAPAETHQRGRVLNALTSPDVTVREAVLASCAVPGIFPPVQLMARDGAGRRVEYASDRRWVDGSVTNDLPFDSLTRLYGVNHFIVSQAHPFVAPFASRDERALTFRNECRGVLAGSVRRLLSGVTLFSRRVLRPFPNLQLAIARVHAVAAQRYTGDINIVRPPLFWPPRKILGLVSSDDVAKLIGLGERMTWARLKQIKMRTAVQNILEEMQTATPAMGRSLDHLSASSPSTL